MIQNKHRCPDC